MFLPGNPKAKQAPRSHLRFTGLGSQTFIYIVWTSVHFGTTVRSSVRLALYDIEHFVALLEHIQAVSENFRGMPNPFCKHEL